MANPASVPSFSDNSDVMFVIALAASFISMAYFCTSSLSAILYNDEFNAMVPFEFNAKCLEKMGNRLYAANIKELSWDVEDATAINNTTRQVIGAIGSSVTVVVMQLLANGNISHNQLSVNSFSLTSLMMIMITVILLILTIFSIKNRDDIVDA